MVQIFRVIFFLFSNKGRLTPFLISISLLNILGVSLEARQKSLVFKGKLGEIIPTLFPGITPARSLERNLFNQELVISGRGEIPDLLIEISDMLGLTLTKKSNGGFQIDRSETRGLNPVSKPSPGGDPKVIKNFRVKQTSFFEALSGLTSKGAFPYIIWGSGSKKVDFSTENSTQEDIIRLMALHSGYEITWKGKWTFFTPIEEEIPYKRFHFKKGLELNGVSDSKVFLTYNGINGWFREKDTCGPFRILKIFPKRCRLEDTVNGTRFYLFFNPTPPKEK